VGVGLGGSTAGQAAVHSSLPEPEKSEPAEGVRPTIQREPTKRGDQVKVTFSLAARDGSIRMALVGDFNGWRAGPNMFKRRGELEVASITLSAGRRYEFRYVDEDGTWFNDEQADAYVPNKFGGDNSVVDLRNGFERTGDRSDDGNHRPQS
jgi:1,4-alpha-glucan branching enzyme